MISPACPPRVVDDPRTKLVILADDLHGMASHVLVAWPSWSCVDGTHVVSFVCLALERILNFDTNSDRTFGQYFFPLVDQVLATTPAEYHFSFLVSRRFVVTDLTSITLGLSAVSCLLVEWLAISGSDPIVLSPGQATDHASAVFARA